VPGPQNANGVRVLLYTGKGGVGKTTAAAGTATLGAARGLRTLVLSTDAAHSLADAFDEKVAGEPTEIDDHLFVQQVDAQHRFEASWGEIQGYLLDVLDSAGVDPIAAEELTVLPGAEEILALLELRDQVKSGHWDLVVVDCAPTAETLRLLALPEALTWYMDRVFPAERRIIRTFKPVLTRATGVPMPHEHVFDAVERLHADLLEVREILTGADASVRLVLTPEAVVVAEARRSMTTLSLYGYRVDGVVANRIFPSAGADEWRQQWVATQSAILEEVHQSFAPMPIWHSPYRSGEPVGVAELGSFATEVYADDDPFAPPTGDSPVRMERDDDSDEVRLHWDLPFAARDQVDLARHGDELVVTVGSYRRVLAMPAALRKCEVAGAGLQGGALVVRFRESADEGAPARPDGEGTPEPREDAQ
jgi:arsenite/tail-anchored protein-transporting ATPase